ncbi:hypothetical protein GCM10023231_19160 [Olivibacter ginsenosidimutans]|uniref:Acetyl xylan esterase domain-containing protein n=2 Tax=Olivibacter ginsenosidimutans TaxID=1176537 RepID=A0ABP9B960_9SPHI
MLMSSGVLGQTAGLSHVLDSQPADFIAQHYRSLAAKAFQEAVIPSNKEFWLKQKNVLKQRIIQETGVQRYPNLPLEIKETGMIVKTEYRIKNIRFQTRPGVYATANLYIPEGKGPFPGVLITHGHWPDGRRAVIFQEVAQVLAQSGYVALTIDAWGAGERCTIAGEQEYHGANLGASLFNIGQSLLGMQLTDNIRAVDLLCSLPGVDSTKIGATGSSGGGNQTMWLAALDERIKAAIPVVSVGTFQSYVMNSNCVCELLPHGLSFTEESAVLGLIAPRALKVFNANQDANPSFFPAEMLRTYANARKIYALMGAKEQLSYQRFDTGHGYWPVMQEAMLGWFDHQLKGIGDGSAKPRPSVLPLPAKDLATYPDNQREKEVASTADFCRQEGSKSLDINHFKIDKAYFDGKRESLKQIIGTREIRVIKRVDKLGDQDGWRRMVLRTMAGQTIPFLWYASRNKVTSYQLFIHSQGKDSLSSEAIEKAIQNKENVILLDLWGTGEQASPEAQQIDGRLPPFHTLARSALWLGRTVIGEWVADLEVMQKWLKQQGCEKLTISAYKETAVAALAFSIWNKTDRLILYDCPKSYHFDQRDSIDYYNMAIHLPGIIPWGDVALMKTLSTARMASYRERTMSGRVVE